MSLSQKKQINSDLSNQALLEKRAIDSSAKNRSFLTIIIITLTYITLIVLQTTDVDLLLDNTIKLPIFNINIPLFAFYLGAPLVVFALHFNLLHNTSSHWQKLDEWSKSFPEQKIPNHIIPPSIFDSAMLGDNPRLQGILNFVIEFLFFWSGPIVCLLLFWRFTDYQSLWSIWHIAVFVVNLYCAFVVRKQIKNSRGWVGYILILLMTAVLVFSLQFIFAKMYQIKTLNDYLSDSLNIFYPKIIIDPRISLFKETDELKFRWDTRTKSDNNNFNDWFIKNEVGIDLRARNLIGANLYNANLRKALLSRAQLQGAHLRKIQLQGADLSFAQLQGVSLRAAQLQGANLSNAQLQAANLFNAQLHGAYLMSAQLQVANLMGAQLQGAHLMDARLQGATLGGETTRLQGAILNSAHLQGAILFIVQLQGAILDKTEILGVNILEKQKVFVDDDELENAWSNKLPSTKDWQRWSKISNDKFYQQGLLAAQKRVNDSKLLPWTPELVTTKELSNILKKAVCDIKDKESRNAALTGIIKNYKYVIKYMALTSVKVGERATAIVKNLKQIKCSN